MRLRLLKLSCLFLVLVLAGGLIVFNFASDDLESAFIQTSSVTPATGLDIPAAPQPAPQSESAAPSAAAPAAPSDATASAAAPPDATASNAAVPEAAAAANATPDNAAVTATPPAAPATGETGATPQLAGDVPAPSNAAQSAAAVNPPAQPVAPAQSDAQLRSDVQAQSNAAPADQEPASVAAVEGNAFPPLSPTPQAPQAATPAPAEAAPAKSNAASVASAATGGSTGFPATLRAPNAPRSLTPDAASAKAAPVEAAVDQTAKPPGVMHKAPAKHAEIVTPPAAPAAPNDAAAYQVASTVPPTAGPPAALVAQAPPSHAPLAPSDMHGPAGSAPLFGSQIALGPQVLVEFPSVQSTASGSLAGTGSVTNSASRAIPGLVGSWTSAPMGALPLTPSFGGSLFVGAPASGDSVATATTTGGYTLKLGETNNWPVIMPRVFMGLPVTDGTRASLGTGVWVNNIKETATLANSTTTQIDEHSGMTVRPFLNAAITQRVPLVGFLPAESQELKFSGGYIFGDTNFQSATCAAGQTCVKTSDQGSWFLGLSFQFGFPVGGAPGR